MIVIICVDDRMGMAFNHRRQSQDRALREHLRKQAGSAALWMSPYSAGQFKEGGDNIRVSDDFKVQAAAGDFCFVEFLKDLPEWSKVNGILLYRWNRAYPSDQKLEIPAEFHMVRAEEFPGYSHERITMERYER